MLGENYTANDAYSDYPVPPPSSGPPGAPLETRDRDPIPAARGRSRSRSPVRGVRSPPPSSYRGGKSPAPLSRPKHAPISPPASKVLGVFGLSIRTTERDLDTEFNRFGRVEKVTIVYDQRSDRSRGFGFITLSSVDEATRCIQELNGVELNGRRIRVDYSMTDRAHAPTPGEYMGHRRSGGRDRDRDRRDRGDPYRDSYRDRDYRRDDYDRYDRDRYERDRYTERYDRYADRDRDPYSRDGGRGEWRRRTPPPVSRRGYSPGNRPSRRSFSRSPVRGGSPPRAASIRDYDIQPPYHPQV